ncbi:DUF1013 domain-containing protein [Rickettsiales endosymbiont of Paramecium tredecaurelia]|uniref:cell cycle transcriptional regulator TrcR n=1 Tax=Candidatus Sarmatiella mevalonica TaxID=2770581 RepID=UPI001921BC77|nr:cell cycle transcriptional regulator TrcR [Candidatus Sarmatiella mevalonica]MBL3284809.1 DUF1013 domain-containing protein [Candidatus Sarmatiella mevalonica]
MTNSNLPLFPKATAIWLVHNTRLTFPQIAEFCGLHILEVGAIADGEAGYDMHGMNPIYSSQLTKEEIDRCERDTEAKLMLRPCSLSSLGVKKQSRKSKYVPVARRQDKPSVIAWLLKYCPGISDSQIIKFVGTTRGTLESIKNRTHWNITNITPKDPVLLGICTQTQLDDLMKLVQDQNARSVQHMSEKIVDE